VLQAGAFGTILNDRGEVFLCHRRDMDPRQLGLAFRHRLLEWSKSPDETALITDEHPSTRELIERGQLPW